MVSNGPGLLKQPGDSSKDDEFIRLIKEELPEEKVIVFTRFASGIPFLEIQCERNQIKYTKITGECTDIERSVARQTFQTSKDTNIIFITMAGSNALNLQSASTIIFIDTPWSYGDLVQTIGRAQRIGSLQEHVLLIHLINKGTIDVRVMDRVGDKKELSDVVIGDTARGALDFTTTDTDTIDDLYASLLKDAEI
jgi:SNF2 family DNA or RNA helicase